LNAGFKHGLVEVPCRGSALSGSLLLGILHSWWSWLFDMAICRRDPMWSLPFFVLCSMS